MKRLVQFFISICALLFIFLAIPPPSFAQFCNPKDRPAILAVDTPIYEDKEFLTTVTIVNLTSPDHTFEYRLEIGDDSDYSADNQFGKLSVQIRNTALVSKTFNDPSDPNLVWNTGSFRYRVYSFMEVPVIEFSVYIKPAGILALKAQPDNVTIRVKSSPCGSDTIWDAVPITIILTSPTPTPPPPTSTTGPGTVTPTSGPPAPTETCLPIGGSCGAVPALCCDLATNECYDPEVDGRGTCRKKPSGPALQIIIPTPICAKQPTDITIKTCPANGAVRVGIVEYALPKNFFDLTADGNGIAVLQDHSFPDPPVGADSGGANIVAECDDSRGEGNFTIEKCVPPTPTRTPTPTHALPVPPHCAINPDTGQPDVDPDTGFCLSIESAIGNIPTRIGTFVNRLLGLLIGIGAGIAVIIIIYAGYKLMTSQGDPEAIQNAKNLITSAIVGLLFIVFSIVILEVIGVDILHIPFWGY